MFCPFCGSGLSKVVDKRSVLGEGQIKRRGECLKCTKRFTTYEKLADVDFVVVKRDGRREVFSKQKLSQGVMRALEKTSYEEKGQDLIDKIERKLRRKGLKEISSKVIGTLVLTELKKLDTVAYLRFASVYRQFKKSSDFMKELESLGI